MKSIKYLNPKHVFDEDSADISDINEEMYEIKE